MTLRNGRVQIKIIKSIRVFQNKHLKFLSKHFAEYGKEKLFQSDFSLKSNLKNAKTNTIPTI